jgi:hypothetical protein
MKIMLFVCIFAVLVCLAVVAIAILAEKIRDRSR